MITEYVYNTLGQLTAEKDNAGKNTRYSYDAAGRLSTITNAIDQTVVYTYDERGNIASIKETDGNTTSYTYDSVGNIVSSTDAEGKVTTYSYDLNGNLLSKTDYAQRIWLYYYDAANRLTSTKNPLEEVTAYEYNAMDFITKETNAKGVSTVNEYDIAGNLLSVTDGNGNKTSYEYDDLYRIIAVTAADGGKQEYAYDAVNNLINYKDALGNITAYSYDSMDRAVQITKPTGGIYQYAYDAHDNQTSVTDPLGNITTYAYDLHSSMTSKTLANGAAYTYAYDAIGRITGQTAPEGLSKSYTYDAAGNLASETDQSNRTTTYAYDQMHRLTSSTNPKNATTSFGYDVKGNLTSVVTPKGYTTQYEYDVLDRITKSLDPTGKVSEMQYDAAGNLERVVENGGRVYSYTHDNVGNLLTVTNPLNQTQSFTYDSMNRKTSETDLGGNTQSYTYDLNGQMLTFTNKLGGVSSFEYDGNGNILSATDAENRKVSYVYDLADRLISVTEADTVVAEYAYDSVGNLTSYKDGNGKITTYTYNQLGDMTSMTDPLGNVKEFSYNANAMLDTVTNPDDSTVHYDYDVLDQMISKSYDEDEDAQALWGYDADGNRISMDDVAGTTNYEYDSVGKITAVNLANGKKITYTYDEYGNLAKLTYPDNTTVDYTYNELNQLTKIKDRQNKVTSYERDVNGYVVKVTRPNNTYTTIEHDAMGNVVKVVNMGKNPYYGNMIELSKFEYTYDQSGFIKSEIATNGKTVVTNLYNYDSRAQLISNATLTTYNGEVVENTETTYTYDNAGNRLTSVKKSGENLLCNITYVYNDNSQITDITGSCDENESQDKHVVLSYDVNGNLIKTQCNDTEKVMDYTYDNENRLKAVKENGTLLMAALYDGNGDRIFRVDYRKNPKYISNLGGTAENVYYNYSSGGISYDHDMIKDEMLIPNGVTQNSSINYELTGYINDINSQYTQVLMEYGANQGITNVYEYGDQRNSGTFNGKKGYYLYDGRGSVSSVSGQTGGNMVSYIYDAYGNTTVNSGSPLNNPYQYNAEYTDSSTGNQYLRARYYDPASGRFLTKDTYLGTVDSPLSRNLYTYVRNNPLNLIDPSGYFFEQIFGVGAGAGRAVWDGVGGLFTGNGFSGFKSGWNEGYKAGSDVGRKWDNDISDTFNKARYNRKVDAIKSTDKEIANIKIEYDSTSDSQKKTKLQKQYEELLEKRRKLCETAEKIQKQLINNDVVNLPDEPFFALEDKQYQTTTPLIPQETGVWCWAASDEMMIATKTDPEATQRETVEQIKGGSIDAQGRLLSEDGELMLNSDGEAIFTTGTVNEQLEALDIFSNGRYNFKIGDAPLSEKDLQNNLLRNNPVIITRGWYDEENNRNGGHVTIIVGYNTETSRYIVNDPWAPGVGEVSEWTYGELINGSSTGKDTGRWEKYIIYD